MRLGSSPGRRYNRKGKRALHVGSGQHHSSYAMARPGTSQTILGLPCTSGVSSLLCGGVHVWCSVWLCVCYSNVTVCGTLTVPRSHTMALMQRGAAPAATCT